MAAQYQTPGVYVVEKDGFSSSVVEVPTAVPVFIGYTEVARNGKQDLSGQVIPLTSMLDFLTYFGDPANHNGAPQPRFGYGPDQGSAIPPCAFDPEHPRFNLYYAIKLFFMNGGGNCYVLSIGTYGAKQPTISADVYTAIDPATKTDIWQELEKHSEPTIVVLPDSVLLSADSWTAVAQAALLHCNKMQNRVVIFDIVNGYLKADGMDTDPIEGADGETGFVTAGTLGEEYNKYGIAYYPWINTSLVDATDVDFTWLNDDGIAALNTDLVAEAEQLLFTKPNQADKLNRYKTLLQLLIAGQAPAVVLSTHQSVLALSPLYKQTMKNLAISVNLLPPGGAMAGVYARVDSADGVWQSPANTGIIGAISPALPISDNIQDKLNVPLNGYAVNAIRSFPGFGLLVWGARTMAGNSDDWRYISVRRTVIMLEQSIKVALHPFVFAPNTELTWTAVERTVDNFLNTMWSNGALQGAKPADAYAVSIGLGSTMTAEDILQGYMRMTVRIAVTHPAEFIELTFQQQAAVS